MPSSDGWFKKGERRSPRTEFKKGENLREKHPRWKGGRKRETQGYILILNPQHIFANNCGYVREHRLVMEEHLGRYLLPTEVVHHINGVKDDNRIENLRLMNDSDHKRLELNRDKRNFNRTGCHPKTEFKKGMIPWNKGLKMSKK